MAPNSKINLHSGETNATIRVHLALIVPSENENLAGLRVGNETQFWKEGRSFAFLDAHQHEAWNDGSTDRYVLIIDTLRPEFTGARTKICTRIILNQLFYNVFSWLNNKTLLKKIEAILPIAVYPAMPFFKLGKWVQSRFGLINL
jgi:aspartyl/asparaginyl beta-hydroxylase (cupin superfamily)